MDPRSVVVVRAAIPIMAEIQFIVDKLNEPPFSKDLRLVRTGREFFIKTPVELVILTLVGCSSIRGASSISFVKAVHGLHEASAGWHF